MTISNDNQLNQRTFSTKRLQVAVFLHATGKLKFLGCELDENPSSKREVYFQFADPGGIGDELELDYEGGEAVSAVALFASQKFLRRKLGVALGEGPRDGRLGEQFGGRRLERRLERQDGNLNGRVRR